MTTLIDTMSARLRQAFAQLEAWFDLPVEADARPLEIREAVIDAIERRAEPAAAGRRVLPHNHATISVIAEDKDNRAALEAALEDVADAVRARLVEIRCPVPNGFDVDVHYLKKPKVGWKPQQRFAVELDSRTVTRAAPARGPSPPVLRSTSFAARPRRRPTRSANCTSHRANGRADAPHGPTWSQHSSVEEGDAHSATVGRAHASIRTTLLAASTGCSTTGVTMGRECCGAGRWSTWSRAILWASRFFLETRCSWHGGDQCRDRPSTRSERRGDGCCWPGSTVKTVDTKTQDPASP